jgi:integrase/recombinase XerD
VQSGHYRLEQRNTFDSLWIPRAYAMQQLFDQFIRERLYLTGVTPATIKWHQSAWKVFQSAFADGVSKTAIVERIAELSQKLSKTSINTHLRSIQAFLNWLAQEGKTEPLKLPKLKEEKKILATLTEEQIRAIASFRPNRGRNLKRIHLLALLLLDTGLRLSEALALKVQNLDYENLCIRVSGKGQKERLVPMSRQIRKHLFTATKSRMREANYLFCTASGLALSQRNALRDFRLLGTACGIRGVRFSPIRCAIPLRCIGSGEVEISICCLAFSVIVP